MLSNLISTILSTVTYRRRHWWRLALFVEGGSGPGYRRSGSLLRSCGILGRPWNLSRAEGRKDPRIWGELGPGGPERWPGSPCLYCKVVMESRMGRAKKTTTATIWLRIYKTIAKFGERDHYRLKNRGSGRTVLQNTKCFDRELNPAQSVWQLNVHL